MGFALCRVPHPIFLVLPERCLTRAAQDYADIPLPQTAAEVEADFLTYSEQGVMTLVDDKLGQAVSGPNQGEQIRISFCTSRYELVCDFLRKSQTQQQDAYLAIRLVPLSLRTHNQIARGCVMLAAQSWSLVEDLADASAAQPAQTGIEAILASWRAARVPKTGLAQPGQNTAPANTVLSAAQLTFLANVDTLIDLACQVELEKAAQRERIPVKAVAAQPVERGSANTYRFQLLAPVEIRVGEYLQTGIGEVQDAGAGYTGVVAEITVSSLLLRFRQPIDLKLLQRVEWLAPKPSTKQYNIQHAAVNALRNGQSLNQNLLPLVVENLFEAYPDPGIPISTSATVAPGTGEFSQTGRPNPAQKTMIARALIVPDLLLALGPPGTGKTDTIREIVARQAALGKKVLVTSKNNKAVDNVLEGLQNVQALRIGREEVVSAEVRPMLIDNRASTMQQKILSSIQPVQQNLDNIQAFWPQVEQAIERLAQLADERQVLAGRFSNALADLAGWQRAAYTRVERSLERQQNYFNLVSANLTQLARQADGLRQRLESIQRFSRMPLVGPFFVLLADQFARDWQDTSRQYHEAMQEVRKAGKNMHAVWQAYYHFAAASEQALEFKRVVAQAEQSLEELRARTAQAQDDLIQMTEGLPGRPAGFAQALEGESWTPPDVMDAALRFPRFARDSGQCATPQKPVSTSTPQKPLSTSNQAERASVLIEWRGWYELMMRRKGLLTEWRELLETRPLHEALYPALIRGADVIGATCIGIATDARFEDLEFDLVIADEAGQIQVMDLLVPLVRARRAILVGDHLQLPPVVEAEITQKIRENEAENQELGDLLQKSLFERIIERPTTPESNKVMLDTQYRMPRQIADFISAQFYGGNYHTSEEKTAHTDVFFSGSPMVFVDTLREVRHFEQQASPVRREAATSKHTEPGLTQQDSAAGPDSVGGYVNSLEARLICDLLLAYQAKGVEAGVIVPYKKQAELIRRELRRRSSGLSENDLTSRVSTVDSFQGREQDVIIFGFTRSNSEGRIGFLTELRRLNVSLTRARQQLVLVGDSITLTETEDQDFARLMKALLASVKKTPKGYFYANELPRHIQVQ